MSSSLPVVEKDCLIRVSRFDAEYPKDEANAFVVGFVVTSKSNMKTTYQDIQIPYSEIDSGSSDEDVVRVAWSKLRSSFQTWFESIYNKQTVLGMIFDPQLQSS